jgi:RNA-directed DNA polymerase
LLRRAVRKHTDCRWLILCGERWLQPSAQLPDGALVIRDKGTSQGGVISPRLANLFLHYAFDVWLQRHYPVIFFERYADDILVHCKSEKQAFWLKDIIARRLVQCHLEL